MPLQQIIVARACVCVCVCGGGGGRERKHSDSQYSPHSPNVEVGSKGLKKIPAFMQEYIGLDFPSYKKCDSFLISTQFYRNDSNI